MIQGATIRRPMTTRAATETTTIPVSHAQAGIARARERTAVTLLTSNLFVVHVASWQRSWLAPLAGSRKPRFAGEPRELDGVVEADACGALGDAQEDGVLHHAAAGRF